MDIHLNKGDRNRTKNTSEKTKDLINKEIFSFLTDFYLFHLKRHPPISMVMLF